ncbi:hypothetical protein [Chryseobacterium sp.]|uniref:hypothetical protein n=1 Tax=Chryseobacterium sp. TaxID=1871047 RepID=UPI00289D084B|nr:hypothetical protein [Chryseobacterium sp.]
MQNKNKLSTKIRNFGVSTFLLALLSVFIYASQLHKIPIRGVPKSTEQKKKDSIASVEAFKKVYSVLMHPRCMNCHPTGDIPLQGDDSHVHNMLPQRGKDGKGVSTMKCITCHASKGVAGDHTPPGNANWHLPPADMKMVFQGKSPRELALQLVDSKKNGHKDMRALRKHAEDDLVKTGWTMGGDRTLPPLTYEEFRKAWYTWIDNGAYAPAK